MGFSGIVILIYELCFSVCVIQFTPFYFNLVKRMELDFNIITCNTIETEIRYKNKAFSKKKKIIEIR